MPSSMTYVNNERNSQRAARAENAIQFYKENTGTEDDCAVLDFLSDLMHLCRQRPEVYGTFEHAMDRADRCFAEEFTGEE